MELNDLGTKLLELKKQVMQNILRIAPPNEALYRENNSWLSKKLKSFLEEHLDPKERK